MLQQKQKQQEKIPVRSKKRFPELLRLFIFSYIDTKFIISHLSLLSKKERERIFNSYIIREGKQHRVEFDYDSFDAPKK